MNTYLHLFEYLAEFFLEREMLQTIVEMKSKHTFCVQTFFFLILPLLR